VAERTYIDGFGAGVKKWASEETAKEIASVLKDMHLLSQKQEKALTKLALNAAGSSGTAPDAGAFGDLTDAINDITDAANDSAAQTQQDTQATQENTTATRSSSLAMKLFKASVAAAGASIVYAFGASFGAVFKQARMVADLNASGIQLASVIDGQILGGLNSFGQATLAANLSFKELSDLSKKYGAVLNKFGIQAFAETSRSVTKDLNSLGITSAESSELVAEYLQSRRFMTYQEQMTQQQQSRAAATMIRQIDRFSTAFGESRAALMASSTKGLEQVDVQSFLKSATDNTRTIFEDLSARFSGAEFGELQTSLLQAVSNPIVQQTEMFEALRKGGATEAMNALVELNQATRTGNVQLAEVKRNQLMAALRNADTELSQLIGAEGQMLRNFVNQSKNHYDLMTKSQNADADTEAARIVNLQNSFRNISKFFERVSIDMLGNQEFTDAFSESMELLSASFTANGPKLATAFSGVVLAVVPLIAKALPYIITMFDKLTEWASGVGDTMDKVNPETWFDNLNFSSMPFTIAKYMGLAIAGGVGVAIIGGAIGSGIASLLSKVAFGGGSSGGGLFGSMFKGVGKGIGAIMQGFANGLAAFGHAGPAVLKGAAVISAVVVLLSGAVALGMAAISLALPGFAKGLRAFDELNGDNLAKVGDGVMKLGAGLAAMGAGKIMDVFGSLGQAIMGFFTGEKQGPIEMLKMFAGLSDTVGPGIAKLGNALSGFLPSLNALIDTAARTKDMDMSDFVGSLDSLTNLNLDSANLTIASVLVDTNVIDTSALQAKIDTALSDMNQTQLRQVPVTKIDASSIKEARSSKMHASETKQRIRDLNNMIAVVAKVNDLRLTGNAVTLSNSIVKVYDDLAKVNDLRLTGNAVTLSNSIVKVYDDLANVNAQLLGKPFGITEIPSQIDQSADQLAIAIARYIKEFSKLENIKPISASARVEYSPITSNTKRNDTPAMPSYQNIDYTKAPMQVKPAESQAQTTDQSQTTTRNPEISKTNVSRAIPSAEPEINSLVKEQNKILGNLVIAMDTSNKRLKSLVRINEERG
jgi:hypothetical protein